MINIKTYWLIACCVAALVYIVPATAQQQQTLSATFGIPSCSPGGFWPRGSSIESLGFGRLYPNGPEFGLSNSSGGFGLAGSGPLSGIGLSERTVPNFVIRELERPNQYVQRLTDAFNRERIFGASLLSTVISSQFRAEMQKNRTAQNREVLITEASAQLNTQLYVLPSVDRILQDQMPTIDVILKTEL